MNFSGSKRTFSTMESEIEELRRDLKFYKSRAVTAERMVRAMLAEEEKNFKEPCSPAYSPSLDTEDEYEEPCSPAYSPPLEDDEPCSPAYSPSLDAETVDLTIDSDSE